MDKMFDSLPSSTNAVESHNRLCKSEHVQILKVAMLVTYRKDMSITQVNGTVSRATNHAHMVALLRVPEQRDHNSKVHLEETATGP